VIPNWARARWRTSLAELRTAESVEPRLSSAAEEFGDKWPSPAPLLQTLIPAESRRQNLNQKLSLRRYSERRHVTCMKNAGLKG
jgi:hypothetical protein